MLPSQPPARTTPSPAGTSAVDPGVVHVGPSTSFVSVRTQPVPGVLGPKVLVYRRRPRACQSVKEAISEACGSALETFGHALAMELAGRVEVQVVCARTGDRGAWPPHEQAACLMASVTSQVRERVVGHVAQTLLTPRSATSPTTPACLTAVAEEGGQHRPVRVGAGPRGRAGSAIASGHVGARRSAKRGPRAAGAEPRDSAVAVTGIPRRGRQGLFAVGRPLVALGAHQAGGLGAGVVQHGPGVGEGPHAAPTAPGPPHHAGVAAPVLPPR